MTPDDQPSPRTGQLSEEAALWFARMRGPEAEQARPDFEAWLSRGALHLAAYNRAAEVFAMGKFLADEENDRARARRQRRRHMLLLACWIGLAFLIGALLGSLRTAGTPNGTMMAGRGPSPASGPTQFATLLGEIRQVSLNDGSTVTLDSDSLVTVAFDADKRRLRLERGRARFEVAHDRRPLVVAAGGGTVTARGTMFDVSITGDKRVTVKLLHGRVDVAAPAPRGPSLVHLRPGEEVAYAGDMTVRSASSDGVRRDDWPSATIDYDNARLADVIERANRGSAIRIRLGEAAIGQLLVSGRFRTNDAEQLVSRLALLFGLVVDRTDPSELILRRRPTP